MDVCIWGIIGAKNQNTEVLTYFYLFNLYLEDKIIRVSANYVLVWERKDGDGRTVYLKIEFVVKGLFVCG